MRIFVEFYIYVKSIYMCIDSTFFHGINFKSSLISGSIVCDHLIFFDISIYAGTTQTATFLNFRDVIQIFFYMSVRDFLNR